MQIGMDCSFSAFYKLRPQNVSLPGDTPRGQYKCVTHENFFLKLVAMGYTYEKNFGKKYYDVSENSQCWLSECDLCKDGEKFKHRKPMNAIVN